MSLWAKLAMLLALGLTTGCSSQTPQAAPAEERLIVREEPVRPYAEAARVRLLVHDRGYDGDGQPIFSDPDGRLLSPAERASFEATLKRVIVVRRPPPDPDVAVETATACFIPHHFFEYLDGQGRVIGKVAVCFCCTGAQAYPRLAFERLPDNSLEVDVPAVGALVRVLGLPTDVGCDPPSAG